MTIRGVLYDDSQPLGSRLSDGVYPDLEAGLDISGGGGGNSVVTLGELFKPMTGIYPDAANGPLAADSGITAGTPTTTGLTLYTPASSPQPFNLQSQYLQSYANGSYANTSGSTVWINHSTPRVWWGPSDRAGRPIESNIDFGFVSDSDTVILRYFHYTGYTASAYHDNQIYVEHEGALKKITRLPRTSTAGGGLFYRTLTFDELVEREFRVQLPMNCWLIGVYIKNQATIRPSPNKPFVMINGDSWNEPAGDTLQSPAGGAWASGGCYRTFYLPQAIAERTGFACGLMAQGGTGYFNANDGVTHPDTYVDALGNSPFLSSSRITHASTRFFPRNPLIWTIGGWNDGALGGTPYLDTYRARVLSGIDRCIAAKSNIQMMFSTIQPAASSGTFYDAFRVQSTLGMIEAGAARPDNVIGVLNIESMCKDMSMSGQRGANVGPDTLHLHAKGADLVAGWMAAGIAKFELPRDYYQGMLEVDVANAGAGPT